MVIWHKRSLFDPRTGLFLLVMTNIIAFAHKSVVVEVGWIGLLLIVFCLCGETFTAIKWGVGFGVLLFVQAYILPVSPQIIATSFAILVTYARRMFPCLMVGSLMIKTLSLPQFIAGLRRLGVAQDLLIPISVTLRYFPAIGEEVGHIWDGMRLRNIGGVLSRMEALLVPLAVSAIKTAEELSAAAVTRGIEDPASKSSLIVLHLDAKDGMLMAIATIFAVAAILSK